MINTGIVYKFVRKIMNLNNQKSIVTVSQYPKNPSSAGGPRLNGNHNLSAASKRKKMFTRRKVNNRCDDRLLPNKHESHLLLATTGDMLTTVKTIKLVVIGSSGVGKTSLRGKVSMPPNPIPYTIAYEFALYSTFQVVSPMVTEQLLVLIL